MRVKELQELVWDYYRHHGRELPWRIPSADNAFNPYKILVSEIMLQQTQVPRVVPKYQSFLEHFPTVQALADAPLADVLREWSGLGYNRRAKYLHEAARTLADTPLPWSREDLVACKGIGPNTAAAVVVYAYNQPIAFIETNVRTVFIHHFFQDRDNVADADILPLVEEAVDHEHPREFFWALMDYGVFLKGAVGNASRASKHYAKQSTFAGSKRQVRGQVLRLLKDHSYTQAQLSAHIKDDRLQAVLTDLLAEKLISRHKDTIFLG